jgi:serine/threonine protein phosphatase PrpC
LKRKRPAKLAIPVADLSLVGVPATPCFAIERKTEFLETDGDGYSVYCKRGRREAIEDRYSAVVDLQGDEKQGYFGIFDGHGGSKAAEFAAENLNKNIMNEIGQSEGLEDVVESVKLGYLKTDADFLNKDLKGGSCCVTALIRNGNIIISNAGDCRAVICDNGIAKALTSDHRPSREDEKSRIESLGGYVDFCHGILRIQGSLAVSRGIGDAHLKKWVIAEPETQILSITSESEFLILASDGLWDKVSNQESVDIARSFCINVDKPDPLSACKRLAEVSASRGSTDDTSVMIIQLGRFRS